MGKKYPEPPDPRETATASTSTNVGTAVANAWLLNPTQITPDGRLDYNQTGFRFWKDPYTKKSYKIPTFTMRQTLSPQQTAIKKERDLASLGLSKLASQQTAFLKNYLKKPLDLDRKLGRFDVNNASVEKRLVDLGRSRLDPIIGDQRKELAATLANQGILLGSEGYDKAMALQSRGENDAYSNLLLSGRSQAFNETMSERQQRVNELLTGRNQPLNEISALLSGSQVSHPSWANANTPAIPTTDVAGLINTNFDQRMSIAQQKNAMTQSILGGLFGLGGKLIGLSERKTKTDIQKVGKDPKTGLNLYAYRYKGDPKTYPKMVGLMADEVEKKNPDAVVKTDSGLRLVDYGKALLEAA